MRTVVLVPRREGKPDRDATWAWVRQWWRDHLPEFEIVEGHHDEGLFNRSAAINKASMAAGGWDVAIIIDADVICDPARVREGISLAVKTGRLVLPFDVRKDLNQLGSRQVQAGFEGAWDRFVHRTYTNMCSSVVIVTRGLWDDTGGFDETFSGWGFEDSAFATACETFSGGPLLKMPGELWHLYHATAPEGRPGSVTHARNKGRADLYEAVKGDKEATRRLRQTAVPDFERRPSGIPPILHRVVPEHTSAEVERWWVAFEKLHSDWTLMTHRDPLDPADWPETASKWEKCANGPQLAGLIRLEALWRWGGIYVDSDVEPYRALDPLLPLSAFAAWEDANCVPDAVIGAVPGHPAIRECLDLALVRVPGDTWKSGPGVTTAVFPGRADVLLLPPGSFYAIHYKDPDRERLMRDQRKRSPWAFGLHHYAGSWLPKEAAS